MDNLGRNIEQWLLDNAGQLLWHAVGIIGFFLLTRLAIRISARTVEKVLRSRAVKLDDRRRETLASLLDNVIRWILYFMYFLIVLELLQFRVQTLLAGAGIAGLVVGFGAQSLIRDILTGLFILFEDQYGVGDVVKINAFTGTVKSVGLRLTRVQAWTGEIEIIPNGQIKQVTNYSKATAVAVVDVNVRWDCDVRRALTVMNQELQALQAETPEVTGEVKVLGIQSFNTTDITLRATLECQPGMQFAVERQARLRIKEAFEQAGVALPVSQGAVPGGQGWGWATAPWLAPPAVAQIQTSNIQDQRSPSADQEERAASQTVKKALEAADNDRDRPGTGADAQVTAVVQTSIGHANPGMAQTGESS
ncbi:MAG: mechanosensitive ion channel family protein [Alicyclobacillus sp.]|nr:mechanosensitive ion channel family protein [Alicyclobacillus sp.]